jgi:hypothetical protein
MKTNLLLSIAICFGVFFTKAQCVNTQTANVTVTNTMVLPPSSSGVVLICSAGVLYDTLMNSNVFKYYLEPGAKLITKNGSTLFINMKATSGYTNYGFSPFNKFVYAEPGATMVSTFSVPITPNTCSVVSFPASPLCAPTGVIKKDQDVNIVSFYPNPAKNSLTINNETSSLLNAQLINALGQKVRSFNLENGKKTIDVSDLNEGLYYISVSENNKTIVFKKIIIVK